MKKNFTAPDWEKYLPLPVCEENPEYEAFYKKAFTLAHDHIKSIEGMPQDPYMDEAFCHTQVWIWDTCFMSLFCKFAPEVFPGVETFNNFYEVLHNGRLLPVVIPPEDEPSWTRTTPGVPANVKIHIADNPPLFAWGEYENALMHGDKEYIKELLYKRQHLQKHYEWIENLKERTTLPGVLLETNLICENDGYRWEGGCSGMDNTPRGRTTEKADKERPNNPDLLWVDAICQQALSARTIARLFRLVDDEGSALAWDEKYTEKKDIINSLYWDSEDNFYYDIYHSDHNFCKVMSIASYWALTAAVASDEQASTMASRISDDRYFGGSAPLVSLSRSDGDFEELGRYWRGSVWLPTAYATLKGLAEYKHYNIAHTAAKKLLDHMLATYKEYEPHTIWECYSPTEHKPATTIRNADIVRPDFCGWSALGPISIYIEYVLGFHTINAFTRTIEWAKPDSFKGNIGIKNLRFGDVVTDIVADENRCTVISSAPYTLIINGKSFYINAGLNDIIL